MDKALLLETIRGVVRGIEVGNEDASETVQHILQNVPLPSGCENVDSFIQVGEGPYVSCVVPDRYLSLIRVDQQSPSKFVLHPVVRVVVLLRCPERDPGKESVANPEAKKIVEGEVDIMIRLAEGNVVVDHPAGEIVAPPWTLGAVSVGEEGLLAVPAAVTQRR